MFSISYFIVVGLLINMMSPTFGGRTFVVYRCFGLVSDILQKYMSWSAELARVIVFGHRVCFIICIVRPRTHEMA